jgi:hypothetical protein
MKVEVVTAGGTAKQKRRGGQSSGEKDECGTGDAPPES